MITCLDEFFNSISSPFTLRKVRCCGKFGWERWQKCDENTLDDQSFGEQNERERERSNTWKFLRMGHWTQHGASQTLLYITAHAAYYMCADVRVWQSVAVSNDDWASLLPYLLLRNAKYYKIPTTSFFICLTYLVLQDGPIQLHIHIMISLKGTVQLFIFNRSNKNGWDCYLPIKSAKNWEEFQHQDHNHLKLA